MKITLQSSVLQWARQRARLSVEELAEKFSRAEAAKWQGKIESWEQDGALTCGVRWGRFPLEILIEAPGA